MVTHVQRQACARSGRGHDGHGRPGRGNSREACVRVHHRRASRLRGQYVSRVLPATQVAGFALSRGPFFFFVLFCFFAATDIAAGIALNSATLTCPVEAVQLLWSSEADYTAFACDLVLLADWYVNSLGGPHYCHPDPT